MTTRHGRADYGDKIAVGMFRWVANGQPVMQDETAGWLKSIHKTRNAELAGLAMVGPQVADMVEARVFALKASVQAFGSFVKTNTSNGAYQSATNSGGVLAS